MSAAVETRSSTSLGRSQRDVIAPDRRLRLRFPTRMREVLELLAAFSDADHLMDVVDISAVMPRDIYNTVLGRAPESIAHARPTGHYDALEHFRAAIRSPEFQQKIIGQFLSAFSDLAREIFVHVPKCAGTDLIINVGERSLALPIMLRERHWVSPDEFVQITSSLARQAAFSKSVFVFGHIQLGEYVELAGIRRDDRIFTILRDPVDLLLSQANYAVSRLRKDPHGQDPDTAKTLRDLEMTHLPDDVTLGDLKTLTAKALVDRRIAQPNRISHYLGTATQTGFEQALTNVVTYNVEVTAMQYYRGWLKERWNIESDTRHNRSDTFLSRREVTRFFMDDIEGSVSEDQKLYDVICWCLDKKGGNSVLGDEIAEMIGDRPLADLPEFVRRERIPRRAAARSSVTVEPPFLVQSEDRIALYLADVPQSSARPDAFEEIVKIEFTFEGNGAAATRDGWCRPEERHIWTNGTSARLELQPPREPGSYTLRVRGAPFVWKDKLPHQRLGAVANGMALGEARVKELALIEWDVPWPAISSSETLQLDFLTPDARRASDIKDVNDNRVLGFAFHELSLLRCRRSGCDAAVEQLEAQIPPPAEAEARSPGAARPAPAPVAAPEPHSHLPLNELMLCFESLGENCEFGLVQRRCGAEPLGLLRFGSSPLPNLLSALELRFDGMGRPDRLEVQVSENGTEYMVLDKQFGFLYHAWVLTNEQTADAVHAREVRRIPFLVRKLIEDISSGEKLLVYHGMRPLTDREIGDLVKEVRGYGEATVLWVEMADDAHPPGSVERIGPTLLKAYIDRFAPGEDAHDLSIECWITLCRNAYDVWKRG